MTHITLKYTSTEYIIITIASEIKSTQTETITKHYTMLSTLCLSDWSRHYTWWPKVLSSSYSNAWKKLGIVNCIDTSTTHLPLTMCALYCLVCFVIVSVCVLLISLAIVIIIYSVLVYFKVICVMRSSLDYILSFTQESGRRTIYQLPFRHQQYSIVDSFQSGVCGCVRACVRVRAGGCPGGSSGRVLGI